MCFLCTAEKLLVEGKVWHVPHAWASELFEIAHWAVCDLYQNYL